nr:PREDICTED: uncharacterized protein LOC109041005 [Bemisia tabaci]
MKTSSSKSKKTNNKAAVAGEKKQRIRIKEKQKKILLDFMINHSIFAKSGLPPGKQAGEHASHMWKQLVDMLNAHGPKRTQKQWQKTWTEWKLRVKKKAAALFFKKTGNITPADTINSESEDELDDSSHTTGLSPLEEQIYQLCGSQDFIGAGESAEIGLSTARASEVQPFDPNNIENATVEIAGQGELNSGENEDLDSGWNEGFDSSESEADNTRDEVVMEVNESDELPIFVIAEKPAAQDTKSSKTKSVAKKRSSDPKSGKEYKEKKGRMDKSTANETTAAYVAECSAMTQALKDCTEALKCHTQAILQTSPQVISAMNNLAQSFTDLADVMKRDVL